MIGEAPITSGVHVSLEELLSLRGHGTRLPLASRQRTEGSRAGDVRSTARGRGMEFEDIRPYQAGDDTRNIHWRISARTGKPFTKLYAEERERPTYIALDQRVNMFFGSGSTFKSVAAARLAALIGWFALASGDRVGGLVAGDAIERVRSKSTRRSFLRLLEAIARSNQALSAHNRSHVTLSAMLDDCLMHSSTGASVLVISDFDAMDAAAITALRALARRRKLTMLRINDPLELDLRVAGRLGIGDGTRSTRVSLNHKLREKYLHQRHLLDDQLQACVTDNAATLLQATTEDDPVRVALDSVRAHFGRTNVGRANIGRAYR